MTIDELLCKFQGLHWHEGIIYPDGTRSLYKCSCMEHQSTEPLSSLNPDFSDDRTALELYRWFSTSKEDMFTEFEEYMDISTYDFIKFKEVDGKNYMRWVVLLSEWLRLEETREKWGWEECPDKNIIGGLCITKKDSKCPVKEGDNCSGKIRAEWARRSDALANSV